MIAGHTRRVIQYGVAVLASSVAVLVYLALTASIGPGLPHYLLFYPAVMASAMLYGLGPGLLATAVSVLLAAYFILPLEGFAVGNPVDLLGLVIFAWMGTGLSLLAGWYQRRRVVASATAPAGPLAGEGAPYQIPHRLGAAPGPAPRRVPLRRWLTLLVLGTAVPLLAFAIVVLVWLVDGYRADQDRRHTETTRALALAVDAEIRSWKAALLTLSGSHELEQGRLGGFYKEAQSVAARYGGWIALTDASGQQLMNTRRASGDPLPMTGSPDEIQTVFRTQQPVVTDLVFGAVSQRYIFAVVVPVVRDGQVRYTLDMAFGPERLVRLLADQGFSATWVIALNDGHQRVVARVPDRPERRGQPVLSAIARAFTTQESGMFDASIQDGRVGRNAFQRLREAPWTVNVMVPVTELQAAWQRPLLAFLLLGGLAVFGAVGLGVRLARKIARPVTEAARGAATVIQGEMPALAPSGIAEVATLQDALAASATTVRTATQAREGALAALQEANESLEVRVRERTAALRDSEAQFRTLADAIPQLAWIARADGWIHWYNRRWYEYTGTTPEQMAGWGWQSVHDPQTLPAVLERWQASIATRQPFEMIFPLRGADGVFRPFLTRSMPLTDAQGNVLQWFGTNTDVAEQQAAADSLRASEQALRAARDELEQRVQDRTAALAQQASQLQVLTGELTLAEQRERQRLAHVLHDGLQQLLVAAKLRLISLPRGDPSGVADECLKVAGLLEEAIASSRTLTGELSPPILQTGGLGAGLEWLVRWKAEKYQLAVTLDGDPEAVPDSEATTLLLFQSVRELLFNVVKHAQVQAARVEVRQQDGYIQIAVSDQGVGFDPATLSTAGTGGLGLASIRQRLEFLGGCVGIVTAPGQGCRITLAAPLQSRAGGPPPLAATPEAGRFPHRPRRGEKIRVLLVDDHAVVRQALAQMLGTEPDLEVIGEAADGKAGVERTKELQPHVVLMDINMPVLSGIDATTQIRATCPGVQVIGLSMFGSAELTAAMRHAGAAAYVSKTAPAEELLAVIWATVDATLPSARPPHATPQTSAPA